MEFKLIIKTLAEQDVAEAAEWYFINANHLTERFIKSIEQALKNLERHPEHYQKRYGEVRVLYTEDFPFAIYYTIEDFTVFIHAILHTKRDPDTGTERIQT